MGAKGPYAFRRRSGKGYRLYFANPQSGTPACKTAERLIKIDGVSEVMVTEGEYGFIVKAEARPDPQGRKVYNAIQSCVKSTPRQVTTHFKYVK